MLLSAKTSLQPIYNCSVFILLMKAFGFLSLKAEVNFSVKTHKHNLSKMSGGDRRKTH